jgi:hypothetical protein
VRSTEIKLEPIFFWRKKLADGWIGPDGFDNNVAPAVSRSSPGGESAPLADQHRLSNRSLTIKSVSL